jgi:uncharacterized Tic20 family protein
MEDLNPKGTVSPSPAPAGAAGTPSAEERQWAMFAHLSALVGGILTSGWAGNIGFFIGPLVIWLMKKDTMPFVNDQAKEALNFAITVSIAFVALLILTVMTLGIGALLTVPLMLIIGVTALVFIVMAAIKANEGVAYRYPFALRLIK